MTMDDPPRSASLAPGEDDVDPYSDVDLEELPRWWRENIEEFERYGMRPYRPARFTDDELVPVIVTGLEDELDVSIRISTRDPQDGNDWKIIVGGDCAGTITHERDGDGFTRYGLDSETFREIVRASVDR